MIYKCHVGHPTVIGFILKNVSKFTAIGHGIFIFHKKIFQNCSFICAHCSPLTALGSHNSNPRPLGNVLTDQYTYKWAWSNKEGFQVPRVIFSSLNILTTKAQVNFPSPSDNVLKLNILTH